MFCKNCGQEILPGSVNCPRCGAYVAPDTAQAQTPSPPIYDGQPYQSWQPSYGQPQQPFVGQPYPIPAKPSVGWLVFNIVLVVLSGFSNILAIVGVVFGALGQSAYNHGDYKDAESKTKVCKVLGIISLVLFILAFLFLLFFFFVIGVSSTPSTYYSHL